MAKDEPTGGRPVRRRLWTFDDGAAELGISTRQLRRLVASGELPVVRIGRAARLDPDDIDALIQRCKS